MDEQARAEELLRKGYDRLDQYNAEGAPQIAEELKKIRNTGHFEIAARAHWMEGDHEKAIAVLEEGIRIAPTVYIFWQYLGEYLSDMGRYDEAIDAFEQSRDLPGQRADSLDYNVALVMYRKGAYEAAWERAEKIKVPAEGVFRWALLELRAWLLLRLGRPAEADALFDQFVAEGPKFVEGPELARWLWIGAEAAEERGDRQGALALVRQAVSLDKRSEGLAALLLRLEDRRSDRATVWRLMVEGDWHEEQEGERWGFFTNYWVCAENPDQALEFAGEFEPEPVRPSLRISEFEDLGEPEEELMGVLRADGYSFFTS
jgi:tetratricopeptide (TPR) repeat protein